METTTPSTDPPPSSSSSDTPTPSAPSLPSAEPQSQSQTPAQQQQRAPPVPRPQQAPARPVQRPGLAMGVPAGYQRPAGPFSTFRPPLTSSVGPNSQVRQSVPGIQTIGMMGSLSTAPTSTQLRPGGVPGQQQQRLGAPQIRSASSSANQTLSSQKFTSHGVPRSITSANTPSSIPQSSQSLQQQFWSSQGKQTHTTSLPSSPYSPQMNQQFLQQRPQHPQQQQQHQLPIASRQMQMSSSQPQQQRQHPQLQQLQQQQQQGSVPNQSQEYLTPKNQQSLLQQQHLSSRGQVSITPNSNIQALTPPGAAPSTTFDDDADGDKIISRRRIQELVSQIDRSEKLHPEIEDDLLEIAGDFIESITSAACHLAKHRKSTTLEAKDILLHVERHWNMTLPGFSGDEIKCYKKPSTNDIHKERLSMVKKSMAGTSDGGSAKNPSTGGGQAAANPKSHAGKTHDYEERRGFPFFCFNYLTFSSGKHVSGPEELHCCVT
ncbi:transcription initiation factor TFIID subunit 12-like [Iris pallida]|uniref:Transcription initiation factor TFIID subunit 12-like n=1 Tax=Iris pallida TaxID=29817 RepID=A0AAX6FXG6_IRIPA|nr:transcription initiation factor TFIID subunit 12-like [Iris pallida]KAJ6821040.1 transcription initiation factor TFIID subunit 12-like [Iris pallida]